MNHQQLTILSYATSAGGIALLALNLAFPYLFPTTGAWSDANAEEYRDAAAELYRLTHVHADHGHDHGEAGEPADLAAARARFDASQQRLDSSLNGRNTMRSVVKWLGILLATVGIGGAVFLRFSDPEG
jgi:hypothetical protein